MLVPPEKDDPYGPVHPADVLSREERCRIYYSRVVDLAVARGLLSPDPNTGNRSFCFLSSLLAGKGLRTGATAGSSRIRREIPGSSC